MKKLLMLAIAAMALAIPASASANPVFTHEGEPITEPKTVEFSGPAAFAVFVGGNPAGGVHCENVFADVDLEANGEGTVTAFETELEGETFCTTTPDNFVAHTTATGLPWDITTDGHDTITIHDVDIDNTVTHPATPHLVVAHRELTGDFHATIPDGQTEDIQHLTLSGEGKVSGPDLPEPLDATVSGTLENTGHPEDPNTQVGTATVDTD